MKYTRFLAGMAALAVSGMALADDAYLRLRCDGEAAGAEVRINGVKKGECPLDLVVPEGKVKLSVRKTVDEHRFKTFEKELFLAAGAMKRESVVLGPVQFTAEGQRLEDERISREKAAAEAAAAVAAEKARVEAEAKKRRGLTQDYIRMLKTGYLHEGDTQVMPSSTWTMYTTYAPLFLPMSTLFDLSSGKDVFAKQVADPAVFANPEAMVSRVARAANREAAAGASTPR
ncbi:MAG: hypothetical protein K0S16_1782 [Moraxellaceae bacterium]|jgi:hypothetical protein|nr:hypothetical protein [Moraxellaceae bacterium]